MNQSTNTPRFSALEKVKTAIYIVVGLYAAYVIVFGTTFFNEFERMMIFGGIISVTAIVLMAWLYVQMKRFPKEIAN